MLIPFLAITDPSMIFNHELGGNFIEWAEISEPQKILLPITIIFCIYDYSCRLFSAFGVVGGDMAVRFNKWRYL